jgi:hypothetical protein
VGLLPDDVLVSALAVRHHTQKIALGPAAHEQRRLLPEHLSGKRLEAIDGGILPVNVVAHLRGSHGGSHAFGGFGNRIAAQVDLIHGKHLSYFRLFQVSGYFRIILANDGTPA